MALDPTFTRDTELRLEAIESALTEIWSLLQNVISREQLNRMNVIDQQRKQNLSSQITSLATAVSNLQTEVAALS